MGWSLLPNALQPLKIYCAPLTIISQLVLFLWQTIEIDSLGHVRVVEALQKYDPVILLEFHIQSQDLNMKHQERWQAFHCFCQNTINNSEFSVTLTLLLKRRAREKSIK